MKPEKVLVLFFGTKTFFHLVLKTEKVLVLFFGTKTFFHLVLKPEKVLVLFFGTKIFPSCFETLKKLEVFFVFFRVWRRHCMYYVLVLCTVFFFGAFGALNILERS